MVDQRSVGDPNPDRACMSAKRSRGRQSEGRQAVR
jgi:hypothetical protein